MTLDSPIVRMKIASWQTELRELTGINAVMLQTTFLLPEKNASWENIIQACKKVTGIKRKDLRGKCRKIEYVRARQVLSFFASKYAGLSHEYIASRLKQDRSSVSLNVHRFSTRLQNGEVPECTLVVKMNEILFHNQTATNGTAS